MEQLMEQIDLELSNFAQEALMRPGGDSLFDFGKMVGHYRGLSKAKELLLNFIAEDEERERRS